MVAYVKQSIGLGTVPNDDTGDDLRAGGDKINDNFDEIFGAITFDAGGAKAITFDAFGNTNLSGSATIIAANASFLANTDGTLLIEETVSGVAAAITFKSVASNAAVGNKGAIWFDAGAGGTGPDNTLNFSAEQQTAAPGIAALSLDGVGNAVLQGDFDPAVTEIQDIGSATFEWDNIFLQNAPTVSDKRKKNNLGSASSLVPMMKLLDPRIFSRKSKVVKDAIPAQTLKRQKTKITQEQKIQIIDDVPTLVTTDVEKPVFKMVTLKDEDGNSIKKDGKVVKYPVPDMENYTVPAQDELVVPHGRPHTGFMAQDVKQAMTDAGIDDWAGYAYHDDNGEDTHVLRLLEFISPMLAYIQELESRMEKLESKP